MGSQKGNPLVIVLIILLLIAISTAGYFYWQYKAIIPSEQINSNNCVPEGAKRDLRVGQAVKDPPCCEGLQGVADLYVGRSGKCEVGGDESSVCAKCGDGICGPGENVCNCSQDCKKSPSPLTKLQVCPERWISDQAPCAYDKSPSECGNREYFIINGQRMELYDVDADWIKQNCPVKKETAY